MLLVLVAFSFVAICAGNGKAVNFFPSLSMLCMMYATKKNIYIYTVKLYKVLPQCQPGVSDIISIILQSYC